MAKIKQKCQECGQEYFVRMLDIFVFKQHTCPEDKETLIISESPNGNVYTCPKCKKVFTKANPVDYNSIGTRIEGSTRSFAARDQRLAKDCTLEFEKIPIPEQTSCQRCRNYQHMAMQANRNRERKIEMGLPSDMKVIPEEVSNADIYRYEILRKTQEDLQETRKAEAYAAQKAERARLEEERRAKLAGMNKPESLLPKPEEMTPLVEPDVIKMEAEAQMKDIHIAELKKQAEAEKQLKAELKKTDTEIERLKKKLKEAQGAKKQ